MATDTLNDKNLDPGEGEPRDFLLNEDGDLAFIGGDLVLVRGAAAIRQEARIRLQTWLGEWFLDISRGIDFRGRIFAKPADPVGAQAAFRAELRKVTGVTSVRDVSLNYDANERLLSLSFEVTTASGDTVTGTLEV